MARLEADRRAAMDQQLVAIRAVTDLEAKLGLTARWTPDHPEYRETIDYMRQRDYQRALDQIQQLVVQRLFELSKANLSGLGKSFYFYNTPFCLKYAIQVINFVIPSGVP